MENIVTTAVEFWPMSHDISSREAQSTTCNFMYLFLKDIEDDKQREKELEIFFSLYILYVYTIYVYVSGVEWVCV